MYKAEQAGAINQADKNGRKPLFFQPKLSVNQPGDVYEQEADDVADKVMRMKDTAAEPFFSPPAIQRKCAHCEEEEKRLQRKENGISITTIPAAFIQRQPTPPSATPTTEDAADTTDGFDLNGLGFTSQSLLERYQSEPQRPPVPPFEAITGSVQGYTSYGRISTRIPDIWRRRSISFTDAARVATGEPVSSRDTDPVAEGSHSEAQATSTYSPRWAIVFSAWDYATWSDVPFVREIVREGSPFQQAIQSEFGHVTNVENPTGGGMRNGITNQITSLTAQLIPGRIAELLIYFEGHGGAGGICGVDDRSADACVDYPELQAFAQTAARAGIHVTFILDSCNVGEIVNLSQTEQATSLESRMTAGGAALSPEATQLLTDIRGLLQDVIPLGHKINYVYHMRRSLNDAAVRNDIQTAILDMMLAITGIQLLVGIGGTISPDRFSLGQRLYALCAPAEEATAEAGNHTFTHNLTLADVTRMRQRIAPLIDLSNQQINILLQRLEQLAPRTPHTPAGPQLVPDHDPNQTPEGEVV